MRYRILVVIEKANRNYSAYAPDVLGCIATGKTIEDTLTNMRAALEIHLRSMAVEGNKTPKIATVDAQFIDIEVTQADGEQAIREAMEEYRSGKAESVPHEQVAKRLEARIRAKISQ